MGAGEVVTNIAYAAFALCDGISGTVKRENTRSARKEGGTQARPFI
jgi:hypothetical protein